MHQTSLALEQRKHLKRVSSKIESTIVQFCTARAGLDGGRFTMSELTEYVCVRVPNIAPDSPGRILRNLRQRGRLNYVIESRKDSLYRVV